jgi:pimeloyl-ACP methyl ester carboxylesterase
LATLLAAAGFPVLRFDFYGCGDSGGECEEGRVRRWLNDISSAVGEIRRRSSAFKISLVGLRLGGTLSMMAGAERQDIDGMVLWDPVISGRAYIEELKTFHREMLRRGHVASAANETQTEFLGFAFPDDMLADLDGVDLLAITRKPANNVLVIESHEKPGCVELSDRLHSINAGVKHRHLPNPQFWIWMEDFTRVPVPGPVLHSILDWISEVYP